VKATSLQSLSEALLAAQGVPADAAREVASALVDADIEGLPSHGLMLLPMYLDRLAAGSVSPTARGRVVHEDRGAAVLDAENALGQVSAAMAADLAVQKARAHGLGAVAVRNAFHFGAAGRFAARMAAQGCIGIVGCNTRPLMPAPGGAERVVGNNPLAIAVPTQGGEPIIADFALSAGAMGRIRLAEAAGDPIPEGWATDAQGSPTTDAAAAVRGMLLPAGGPKGFGLALMIDLLSGGLSGGGVGDAVAPLYGDASVPYNSGHVFIALDVAAFLPPDAFGAVAAGLAARIRSSKPAPGAPSPRVPGDRARRKREAAAGRVALAPATLAALRSAAGKAGIPFPEE
jgi:LDH2 family malate/lactate/ureidoglycolate dehydrogenase